MLQPSKYATLKPYDDFKNKQKSEWSNVSFWYVKVFIFWKCIQHTIHWDKAQMLKKNSVRQYKRHCLLALTLFFFRELEFFTDLLLICDCYMSWSKRFVSLKLCWIFHFRFLSGFIKDTMKAYFCHCHTLF